MLHIGPAQLKDRCAHVCSGSGKSFRALTVHPSASAESMRHTLAACMCIFLFCLRGGCVLLCGMCACLETHPRDARAACLHTYFGNQYSVRKWCLHASATLSLPRTCSHACDFFLDSHTPYGKFYAHSYLHEQSKAQIYWNVCKPCISALWSLSKRLLNACYSLHLRQKNLMPPVWCTRASCCRL